jgi:hypothetical protein
MVLFMSRNQISKSSGFQGCRWSGAGAAAQQHVVKRAHSHAWFEQLVCELYTDNVDAHTDLIAQLVGIQRALV